MKGIFASPSFGFSTRSSSSAGGLALSGAGSMAVRLYAANNETTPIKLVVNMYRCDFISDDWLVWGSKNFSQFFLE
jgi:hypothetical protein